MDSTAKWPNLDFIVLWDDLKQNPELLGKIADVVGKLLPKWEHTSQRVVKIHLQQPWWLDFSSEQLKRAEWLWFDEERIQTLRHVCQLSYNTLSGILYPNPLLQKPVEYLNNIVRSIVSRTPIIGASIWKAEINFLIEYIFSQENIQYGIPYIMSYFLNFIKDSLDKQTINTVYFTGLLDFWRQIGSEDASFGKIPSTYIPKMNVFQFYTAYREQGWWYFRVPIINTGNRLVIEEYQVAKDQEIPPTFAGLGIHQWYPFDIEQDVWHYETLFVLGGTAYRYLKPSDKWLREFIRNHLTFFSDPSNRPWENLKPWEEGVWQWAKRIFYKMMEQNAELGDQDQKPRRWKKQPRRSIIPPVSSWKYSEPFVVPSVTYPKPNILESLREHLIWNNTQQEFDISEVCDNIPPNTRLCVGEYVVNWTGKHLQWREERYSVGDKIPFSPILPWKTQDFVFCFLGESDSRLPSRNLPITSLTVTSPKERKVPALVTAIPPLIHTILDAPIESVWPVEAPQASPSIAESSPTDDFALEILESLESIEITRSSPESLTLKIWEKFQIEYNENTWQFRKMQAPDWVDMDELVGTLRNEFDSLIWVFLQNEAEKDKDGTLSTLTFAYLFLKQKFSEFWGISDSDMKESFAVTRVQKECWAYRFVWKSLYNNFFERFKTFFLSHHGIYIDIQSAKDSGEVQLTLSLKWKKWICATISSQKEEPYYVFSHMEHLDPQVSERIQDTLTNMLFFLSVAWRVIKFGAMEISIPDTRATSSPWWFQVTPAWLITLYNRNFESPEVTNGNRSENERVKDLCERIEKRWRIKFCSGVSLKDIDIRGKNTTERVPVYTIHSYEHSQAEKFIGWLPDDTKLVDHDEHLAFTSNGTGHANVYEHIRATPRLQKYLAIRMAYTINPKLSYDETKEPIPNGAKGFMLSAWNNIDHAIQDKFLSCFEEKKDGRVTRALEVLDTTSGISVFQILLNSFENNNITILHHSPWLIPIWKIREYMRENREITSVAI